MHLAIRRLTLICALLNASLCGTMCGTMYAETARDWASLGHSQAISAGSEIEVRTTGHKRYRGQFKAADADALVVTTASGEQRLARAAVSRVSTKKPGHRLRNTLIGFGIGTAAGLSLGAIADARCTGNCVEGNMPLGKEAGTALGALIGTVIGAVIPTGGWREVYRAP
jgi:hypothetical protein